MLLGTFTDLDRSFDNFLMQYRNADKTIAGKSPVVLFEQSANSIHLQMPQIRKSELFQKKG